jgi:hypothetical protein
MAFFLGALVFARAFVWIYMPENLDFPLTSLKLASRVSFISEVLEVSQQRMLERRKFSFLG